ncbi:hypothetical protein FB382_004147 [Nocardioides ginsengisegetis]|uniref:Excreted virulence factor EspC, type VII ESX diderm n=1 Tax=Nocardioides ginsengisegetis TaxID=661491 RepID=A0A7W3J3U7_9ACTN|nr:hypothetical protein [Nocardioides ginsengisegetis]MBA8805802.1 hypothetical protein [Nocardioides ginsengisegetis]
MAGKHGQELGADLGALWYAGNHDLPQVADDYWVAWAATPSSTSGSCRRGGGLGVDPGASIDAFEDRINKMLLDTNIALTEVGKALCWVADEYRRTDESCEAEFNRRRAALQAAGGA